MRNILLPLLFQLILFQFGQAYAQSAPGTLKGRATNANQPMGFATIVLVGTPYGTTTDASGAYQITDLPAGPYTVRVSAIGHATIENQITIAPGQILQLDIQLTQTTTMLAATTINGVRAITGMGYLGEISDDVIYAGKKTEVLLLDSLNANTAQNNPRQVLGRVPGANYSETEGSGFPTNGIGFRGLNPSQSIETNTRQNGTNVTADLYGYPESYYLPPLEAVERIEVTRGAASLAFGPQFGGVINYVLRQGPAHKKIEVQSAQTGGSFGLFNSYNGVGGQIGKVNYFGYVQYQTTQGWRPNSALKKVQGFGRISYQATSRLELGIEYSILRNRIQMPGGLSDDQYRQDARASYRARNWLTTPWNLATLFASYKISPASSIAIKNTTNVSGRDLVWRNEAGGPSALDTLDPATGTFINREVGQQRFRSNTTELRYLIDYRIRATRHTLASGVRYFAGRISRQGGGAGTSGSDFDITRLDPKYEYDLTFGTTNAAVFAENIFRLGSRLSITPGLRYEYLKSSIKGYNPNAEKTSDLLSNQSRTRSFLLAGIGAQYATSRTTNLYANWSQAYRPIDYSSLTPLGSITTVDPKLKDSFGYNADLGLRGSLANYLNFDLGLFYLQYNNRIGVVEQTQPDGSTVPYRTNIANSVHQGAETYLEINPIKALLPSAKWSLSVFNSLALIDARYKTGEFANKKVEYAPSTINRTGLTISVGRISATYLVSYTSLSYGDATNSRTPSEDAVAGPIPAYTVMDLSASIRISPFTIKLGANNLADHRYFTKRADEYPGPGIIPSTGRSFYIGLSAKI